MYKISDRREAIRQIQRFLYAVNPQNGFVAPSGVFDESTKDMIKLFQTDNRLNVNGIVDIETFNLLYTQYVNSQKENKARSILNTDIVFPAVEGDSGEDMRKVNKIMADLLDYYGIYHRLTDSRYYSVNTSLAVGELRKIYALDEKNTVDEELFMEMTRDSASIN